MILLVIVSDDIVFSRHSEFVSPILACLCKNGDNVAVVRHVGDMSATLTTKPSSDSGFGVKVWVTIFWGALNCKSKKIGSGGIRLCVMP